MWITELANMKGPVEKGHKRQFGPKRNVQKLLNVCIRTFLTWTFVSHITFNLVCTTSYHCIICFKKQGINYFFVFVFCFFFLFFQKRLSVFFCRFFPWKWSKNQIKMPGWHSPCQNKSTCENSAIFIITLFLSISS